MAYDRALADRIRAALADQPAVREVRMFGGLSFMVDERLAVVADTHGDLMIRCDPGRADDLVRETAATRAEKNGRPMSKGWLVVGAAHVLDDEDLRFWIRIALARAATAD